MGPVWGEGWAAVLSTTRPSRGQGAVACPCEDERMRSRGTPSPSSPETARLAELMRRMEEAEAPRARLEFGRALREARGNGVLRDRIVKGLDANRGLLRRIRRRCEAALK